MQQPEQSVPLTPHPVTSLAPPHSSPMGRGRDAVRPAWMSSGDTHTTFSVSNTSKYSRVGDNCAQEFVINLRVCHFNDNTLRRMPIASDNLLPYIKFPIGSRALQVAVTCLHDTGTALNTCQLAYHKNIMKDFPSLIHSCEEFDGSNPFDPIKLCGAITDPSAYDESLHGALLAVIMYHTPFRHPETNEAILLAFALGDDVSVDSILEFSFLPSKHVLSHVLETTFACIPKETVRTSVPNHVPRRTTPQRAQVHTTSENTSVIPSNKDNTNPLPAILNAPLNYYKPTPPESAQPESTSKRVKLSDFDPQKAHQ